MDKSSWEKIKRLIPKSYSWQTQYASKRNRKGRAMGGTVVGVRLEIEKNKDRGKSGREGIAEIKVRLREKW